MEQKDFFTIIDTQNHSENKIYVEYDDVGGYDGIKANDVLLKIGSKKINVSPQQMMELGTLFIALAGVEGIDFEAANELLEGFSLKGSEVSKNLYNAMLE